MPAKDKKKKISLIHSHSDAPEDMIRSTPARNVCSLHLTLLFISFFISTPCNSIDFITSTQPLKDGQTIVSSGKIFELGFFSPGKSKNRYVGIWYKKVTVQTVIWVANRETPTKNSSGIFTIDDGGNLVVSDGKSIFWSSNASVSFKNPTGILLDTGNLVLTDGNSSVTDSRVLAWQSIDHPTDTGIPSMKLGINKKSGENKAMKSWKSPDDPATGRFLVSMDTQVPPQAYLYNGSRPIWRTGQWNGKKFIGIPKMIDIYPGFNLITEDQSTYLTYTPSNSSLIWRLVVEWSGELKATVWLVNEWFTAFMRPEITCDVYHICGNFGICNELADTCRILSGISEGMTTGTPIHVFVPNTDQRSHDYSEMSMAYRPSHADATYDFKYGVRSVQGGGRSSARETIGRVIPGAVAQKILKMVSGTEVLAYVSQVHKVVLPEGVVDNETVTLEQVESNIVRCPDPEYAEKMIDAIDAVRVRGDSVGGVVTCIVRNVPRGLGSPVFDKLEAELAKAVMSLPATKAFEIGSGFAGTFLTGSEHNDEFYMDEDGNIRTRTNRSGGIQGGISNGETITLRIAFKPTSTIAKKQHTVTRDKHETELIARGRHDPCVVPRAVPMVEAMVRLVILDQLMLQYAQCELLPINPSLQEPVESPSLEDASLLPN